MKVQEIKFSKRVALSTLFLFFAFSFGFFYGGGTVFVDFNNTLIKPAFAEPGDCDPCETWNESTESCEPKPKPGEGCYKCKNDKWVPGETNCEQYYDAGNFHYSPTCSHAGGMTRNSVLCTITEEKYCEGEKSDEAICDDEVCVHSFEFFSEACRSRGGTCGLCSS
jgi:hypothetical protein